jgi:hypothetical protein
LLYKLDKLNLQLSKTILDQSLVGSVVIDAEFSRKYYSLIPATVIERGLEPLILTPESD